LRRNLIEGKVEGRTQVTGRWERRHKQLLHDLKKKRGYWKLKERELDRTLWRTCFGRGYGPVVRQTTVWMNEWMNEWHTRGCQKRKWNNAFPLHCCATCRSQKCFYGNFISPATIKRTLVFM
jgi:hypothetical protein